MFSPCSATLTVISFVGQRREARPGQDWLGGLAQAARAKLGGGWRAETGETGQQTRRLSVA